MEGVDAIGGDRGRSGIPLISEFEGEACVVGNGVGQRIERIGAATACEGDARHIHVARDAPVGFHELHGDFCQSLLRFIRIGSPSDV